MSPIAGAMHQASWSGQIFVLVSEIGEIRMIWS